VKRSQSVGGNLDFFVSFFYQEKKANEGNAILSLGLRMLYLI